MTLPVEFDNEGLSASVTLKQSTHINGGYIPCANFVSASQILIGLDDSQVSADTGASMSGGL